MNKLFYSYWYMLSKAKEVNGGRKMATTHYHYDEGDSLIT
jgi:hypothetical protein